MSDKPDGEQPPPGLTRDHEAPQQFSKDDVRAVAGLLGQVSGTLSEIDKRNLGGDSEFIRAKKIDPRQVLQTMVPAGQQSVQPVQQPVAQSTVPVNVPQVASVPQSVPVAAPVADAQLEKRVTVLERVVETFKRITKFKRGVSYTVTTSKITGNFKDPETILDLVANELAKQTKTITLKLNDNSKN